MTWYRIEAPHFCAGILVDATGRVTVAAPILGWTRGKKIAEIERYCRTKRWTIEKLQREASPTVSGMDHP